MLCKYELMNHCRRWEEMDVIKMPESEDLPFYMYITKVTDDDFGKLVIV